MPDYRIPTGAGAAQFSVREFGGVTTPLNVTVAVGATAVRLMKNNPRRVQWLIMNLGTSDLAIDDAQGIAFATGLLVPAGGGSVAMDVRDDGEAVTIERWALTALNTINVKVLEVILI